MHLLVDFLTFAMSGESSSENVSDSNTSVVNAEGANVRREKKFVASNITRKVRF